MPRIAEGRAPAEPTTPEQHERVRRILRAAGRQGAAKGLDGMQMNDVAKDAGVAIATLYRYFPSKYALFTGLMHDQVVRMEGVALTPRRDDPIEAVADVLVEAGKQMLARPLLAQAMLTSNNAMVSETSAGVTSVFQDLLCSAAGVHSPHDEDYRRLRIVEQTWYGILTSVLNRVITGEEAEADTRLATRLLLQDLWD